MALPILLAAGAGILGGGQYLLKKMDERRSASLLDKFQAQLPATQYGQQNYEQAMDMARMIADSGGLLNRTSGDLSSFMTQYLQGAQNQDALAHQRAVEAANLNFDRSTAITNQMDQDYNRDLGTFGNMVQPAYKRAMDALEGNNSADQIAALYNFFQIVEPGGRVTENEDGSFTGVGGSGSRLANWFNALRGDGLDEKSRQQIIGAIHRQYKSQYDNAERRRYAHERRLREYQNQGYNPMSPVGNLGIDWTPPVAPGSTSGLTPEQQAALQGGDVELVQ